MPYGHKRYEEIYRYLISAATLVPTEFTSFK